MFTDANGNMRGHNHPPNFGRKVDGCERCGELAGGAAPRVPAVIETRNRRQDDERRDAEARRLHFAPGGPHRSGACGPVCTAFDW